MSVFNGTPAADYLIGGGGNDSLSGADGNDTLAGGSGQDTMLGGNGDDWIYSSDVAGYFSRPYYDYIPAVFPLLDITATPDSLSGGGGDDQLFAGYGDAVDGGTNGSLGDTLYISFQGASQGVQADFRALMIQSTILVGGALVSNIESIGWLEGSEFADFLAPFGNGYSNFAPVYGRGGDDHIVAAYYSGGIYGGDGNDLLDNTWAGYGFPVYGESGDDTIIGGAGYEHLEGGDGNDVIQGNDGYDKLYGGAGDDMLDGGYLADDLYGGAGNDTLAGGAGVDVAVFESPRSHFSVTGVNGAFTVVNFDGHGSDTLLGIERMKFDDAKIAIDLDGNAGIAARVIGAVLAPYAVSNANIVGIALSLLDAGVEADGLIQTALDVMLGHDPSNAAVVDLLYTNLVGFAPTEAIRAHFVGLLEQGIYTQVGLAHLAAEQEQTAANINLVGLQLNGLEYS
jgi:Ca2+-binding RTX toxin-like protein